MLEKGKSLFFWLSLSIVVVPVISLAWVHEDGFVLFRIVGNVAGGEGPVFNNSENAIINGNFESWSEGIKRTFSEETTLYPAFSDGWTVGHRDGVTTISREVFSSNQTGVPNKPKYYHRWKQTKGTTKVAPFLGYKISGIKGFAGNAVRLSFYAKSDRNIEVSLYAKQSFGGSETVVTILNRRRPENRYLLSTSWKKYTRTFVVTSAPENIAASSGGYLGFAIYMPLAATYTFDIAQVRLERIPTETNIHKKSINSFKELIRNETSGLRPVRGYTEWPTGTAFFHKARTVAIVFILLTFVILYISRIRNK